VLEVADNLLLTRPIVAFASAISYSEPGHATLRASV